MTIEAKTEIRLRMGIDPITPLPKAATANGLLCRVAVIQETYRPDKVDMYFDEALFLCLLDYAERFPGAEKIKAVTATLSQRGWSETALSIDDFRHQWSALPPDDRQPPLSVLVEAQDRTILCIATEFWTRIGGPPEYHDSYTYSVFSRQDLGADVREFLRCSPYADHWDIRQEA